MCNLLLLNESGQPLTRGEVRRYLYSSFPRSALVFIQSVQDRHFGRDCGMAYFDIWATNLSRDSLRLSRSW
jgi:hypothetical protein